MDTELIKIGFGIAFAVAGLVVMRAPYRHLDEISVKLFSPIGAILFMIGYGIILVTVFG